MAKPTPTTAQQEAIDAEKAEQTNKQSALNDSADGQDDIITQKQNVDDAFKALFDYYNDDIIGQYDAERRAINGEFVPSPVTESDIQNVATNPPTGRLVPTPPATDIVRIPEFDGGYTGSDPNNEQQHISDQANKEDALQNGYAAGSGFNSATAATTTSLDSSSTSVTVEDPTNPLTIQVGDIIAFEGASEVAIAEITSVTDNMGGDPPYNFTYGIDYRVAPTGTISSGASLADFNGFTDSERNTKTASNSIYQNVMDDLINQLETEINNRLARLAEERSAIAANDDPDATSELSTADTEASDSETFLNNYLVSTDVSDSGLSSLATERSDRSTFLSTRLTQITNAYTNQTENYYDQRYNAANNRGNTQRGTLRALSNAEDAKSTLQGLANSLQGSIDALNSI